MAKLVYLMGIDGAGKTTVGNHLRDAYAKQGFDVRLLWLRFNHVLTKPLLALARVTGLTRYDHRGGERIGYHDFHRSRTISWLFAYFQYADAWRVRRSKIDRFLKKDNSVLILDRCVYDILVDIIVDTRLRGLHRSPLGEAFSSLLPADSIVHSLKRSKAKILESRPQCRFDKNFETRLETYEEVSRDVDAIEIPNTGGLESTLQKVTEAVGLVS